jgi:tartrate dehydratase beta subunit/fumarate hydratase class I family protein
VVRVDRVFQLEEFGAPEAMWVIEVKDLPTVVIMDAQGGSPHESIAAQSKAVLERLLGR